MFPGDQDRRGAKMVLGKRSGNMRARFERDDKQVLASGFLISASAVPRVTPFIGNNCSGRGGLRLTGIIVCYRFSIKISNIVFRACSSARKERVILTHLPGVFLFLPE